MTPFDYELFAGGLACGLAALPVIKSFAKQLRRSRIQIGTAPSESDGSGAERLSFLFNILDSLSPVADYDGSFQAFRTNCRQLIIDIAKSSSKIDDSLWAMMLEQFQLKTQGIVKRSEREAFLGELEAMRDNLRADRIQPTKAVADETSAPRIDRIIEPVTVASIERNLNGIPSEAASRVRNIIAIVTEYAAVRCTGDIFSEADFDMQRMCADYIPSTLAAYKRLLKHKRPGFEAELLDQLTALEIAAKGRLNSMDSRRENDFNENGIFIKDRFGNAV